MPQAPSALPPHQTRAVGQRIQEMLRLPAGVLDTAVAATYAGFVERTFDSVFALITMRKTPTKSPFPQAKLQLLLRHAAQAFSEKGYEGASIRDISRSSGVSLAGMYYYIESKQKLLYLIQIYTFQTILKRLEKRLAGAVDPVEKLRILIHNHLDYFLRHPVEMKVLSLEGEALEGEYRREVLEIKRRYYGTALDIFEQMRKAGAARRMNPRVAVLSLFGMMNWIHTWHRPQIDPQADALADTMAGMFLCGVMNGHGPASAKPSRMARTRAPIATRSAR